MYDHCGFHLTKFENQTCVDNFVLSSDMKYDLIDTPIKCAAFAYEHCERGEFSFYENPGSHKSDACRCCTSKKKKDSKTRDIWKVVSTCDTP